MSLTAVDARNLMPSRHSELVMEIIEASIKERASKDFSEVRLLYYPVGVPEEVAQWFRETPELGYKNRDDRESNPVMKALGILEERGFKVRFHYEERQFVDMGFIISWE